ncbi:MAG: hypothetical protein PHC38_01535, partial [Weeksellaceae bacterium]|nr:hypothetical protein [Weeksellaceae bacterium]
VFSPEMTLLLLSIFTRLGVNLLGQDKMCLNVRLAFTLSDNGWQLGEVAVNRRRKFRFRRHVAKANFYLLN